MGRYSTLLGSKEWLATIGCQYEVHSCCNDQDIRPPDAQKR